MGQPQFAMSGYRGGSGSNGCRIHVGNLPSDVRERELDDLFYKFGRIRDISIKGGTSGPSFAFIEFDDGRDAEDAIKGRDGYDFDSSPKKSRSRSPKRSR